MSRSEQLRAWAVHRRTTESDGGPVSAEVGEEATRLVTVSAGVSSPSSTRLLADRAALKVVETLTGRGARVSSSTLELAALSAEIGAALVGGPPSGRLQDAISTVAQADVLVVGTPIYKAGISGLFKSFMDLLDNDLMVGKVVLVTATAGSARHAMVVDDHLRPLFAFMRALTVPTSVCATPADWADASLGQRLERAALEVAVLAGSGLEDELGRQASGAYSHEFGSSARHAPDIGEVDFDTPLMRLAAGGSSLPQRESASGSTVVASRPTTRL